MQFGDDLAIRLWNLTTSSSPGQLEPAIIVDAHQASIRTVSFSPDGRLLAREIQDFDLDNSPLVVMSACQTGLGKDFEVGTIGLARAWQYAGASSVVMSLWNVDDEATFELMTEFIRLSATMPSDRALQHAMQRVRSERNDPYFWAGFTIFGLPESDAVASGTASETAGGGCGPGL